jgi:hypothetical protein
VAIKETNTSVKPAATPFTGSLKHIFPEQMSTAKGTYQLKGTQDLDPIAQFSLFRDQKIF